MRATAVVLVLLLLAAIPVSGSQARDDDVDDDPFLPPVQWNASVGIGYISTAPLVTGGLVIVKGGGDPMTGLGAGMIAHRADTGEQVWRVNHTESTTGFEVAPIHLIEGSQSSGGCQPEHPLVVTGWTSGILTAHSLANGSEVWRIATDAPSWGITGGGYSDLGQLLWPTETGLVEVCSVNGTVTTQYSDPDIRTYRSNLGWYYTVVGHINWMLGTETGHLLMIHTNGTLDKDYDLVAMANLTGTWHIRSTPNPVFGFQYVITVHLHGESESRLMYLKMDSNGTLSLNQSLALGPGTATMAAGLSWFPIYGGMNGASFYPSLNGTLEGFPIEGAHDVVGEISHVQWKGEDVYCLPQNSAAGSWLIIVDGEHSIEWVPDVTSYVTAGCGFDGRIIAVANDASWLEVAYESEDWYSIRRQADETLGIESEIPDVPEPPHVEPPESNAKAETSTYVVLWLPFCGAFLTLGIGFFAQNRELKRMIMGVGFLMLAVGLVFAGGLLSAYLAVEPVEDGSGRTRGSDYSEFVDRSDTVLVSIHYPADTVPERCGTQIIHVDSEGRISYSEFPGGYGEHCIVIVQVPIDGASTVEQVTADALDLAGHDYVVEQQTMGLFMRDIGDAEGGSNQRWWTYDLNGGYGTLGMEYQTVEAGDEIDWHFDAGEF
ncbi:MAG TPA: DUF4430 domain-containing protein [Candidatus Poseidoniales archaeon]|nr:DUF4430 domain-containing protein [Candidatus Poseidoniales archaeon]